MSKIPNQRRERYAQARLAGKSEVAAYLFAGYGGKDPKKNARKSAAKLERQADVQARIAELNARVVDKRILSKTEALILLSRFARSTIADFILKDGRAVKLGALKDPEKAASVREVRVTRNDRGDEVLSFKLQDPISAIKLLSDLRGYQAPKKIDVTERRRLGDFTDEELKALLEDDPGQGEGVDPEGT